MVYYCIPFYHILTMPTSNEPWMNLFLCLHQEENISVQLQEQYKKHHCRRLQCLSPWRRTAFFIAHRALLDLIVHRELLDSIWLLSSPVNRNTHSVSNREKNPNNNNNYNNKRSDLWNHKINRKEKMSVILNDKLTQLAFFGKVPITSHIRDCSSNIKKTDIQIM